MKVVNGEVVEAAVVLRGAAPGQRAMVERCERCGAGTREGKPRCTDHVLDLPGAQVARLGEEVREAERRALSRRARVRAANTLLACGPHEDLPAAPAPTLLQDALLQLRIGGPATVRHLGWELGIGSGASDELGEQLAALAGIRTSMTDKGSLVLELP